MYKTLFIDYYLNDYNVKSVIDNENQKLVLYSKNTKLEYLSDDDYQNMFDDDGKKFTTSKITIKKMKSRFKKIFERLHDINLNKVHLPFILSFNNKIYFSNTVVNMRCNEIDLLFEIIYYMTSSIKTLDIKLSSFSGIDSLSNLPHKIRILQINMIRENFTIRGTTCANFNKHKLPINTILIIKFDPSFLKKECNILKIKAFMTIINITKVQDSSEYDNDNDNYKHIPKIKLTKYDIIKNDISVIFRENKYDDFDEYIYQNDFAVDNCKSYNKFNANNCTKSITEIMENVYIDCMWAKIMENVCIDCMWAKINSRVPPPCIYSDNFI